MRTLELSISRKNVEDQIASLLYAWGVIKDSEEIRNIELGSVVKGTKGEDLIPLKVKFRKETEGKLIVPNG